MITAASENAKAVIAALRKNDVRLCMISGVGWPCEMMDSGEEALAEALEQCGLSKDDAASEGMAAVLVEIYEAIHEVWQP